MPSTSKSSDASPAADSPSVPQASAFLTSTSPTTTTNSAFPAQSHLTHSSLLGIDSTTSTTSVSVDSAYTQVSPQSSVTTSNAIEVLPSIFLPNLRTYTDKEGNVASSRASTEPSPAPSTDASRSAHPILLVIGSTDSEGKIFFTTGTADPGPLITSKINTQGQMAISTSVSTIPVVISSTHVRGLLDSGTHNSQALAISTTNIQEAQLPPALVLPSYTVSPSAEIRGSQLSSSSLFLPTATAPPVLRISTQAISVDAQNNFIFGSQTLTPGGVMTLSGTAISLTPGGTQAVVDGSTQILGPQVTPVSPPSLALIFGTKTITPNFQGQYIIGSQTLSPGAMISGTPISLASGGAYAIVGTSIESLASTSNSPLIIGTQTITANAEGDYSINGQTLTPGGLVTVSGTPISLASGGVYAVIGTSTENLAPVSPQPLTFGTQIITADPQGQYVIDGQTLSPEAVITVSGTPISLGVQATDVVIGTSTERLGGFGRNGPGGGGGTNASSGVVGFTGGAGGSVNGMGRTFWIAGLVMVLELGAMVVW